MKLLSPVNFKSVPKISDDYTNCTIKISTTYLPYVFKRKHLESKFFLAANIQMHAQIVWIFFTLEQ